MTDRTAKCGRRAGRPGFTLVEGLVVLGLFGLLVSLLLPAVQQARGAAARAACADRLRQIGLALHGYHDVVGTLPPGTGGSPVARDPLTWASWHARILPYLDQTPAYEQMVEAYRVDPYAVEVPPHTGRLTVLPVFTCPADGRLSVALQPTGGPAGAFTSYVGVIGGFTAERNGLLGVTPAVRLTDVTDGTSHTLMAGERPPPAINVWLVVHHPLLDQRRV